ncbi:serine/threonine-protein kinase [Antrihabitans sp. YC2-6]|uniref:serine/threonine-protein kinase n=1 Tax=Antrihabitans sp. YC2-6 TaxID=2799498 RepID=UPI0018F6CC64|nr:serine/threonine-protein kinase [Antrihabitans sp. YC2-6]MBJ8346999.1 protein kinase [Antrihabitans sp. YC2-6]
MSAREGGPKAGSVITGPEPTATQRDVRPDIPAELDAADLADAAEIGRGGFGVVYRCVQRALDRTVAVKVLTADLDDENWERFLREEHAMGRLSGHPNIVDILHVDVTLTGRPFIVMPFHARGCLSTLIRDGGPLPWQEVVRIGIKVSGAMEWAHRTGILHRDVKPANILLNTFDEPQLTDFGIARVSGGFETSTNVIVGSPAFTAPEILRGRLPSPQSDVYGLGATLFCLLTGHAAYERRSGEKVVAQFLRITSAPVPDLRELEIPADVAAAVEAAMAAEPAERPESAEEFGRMLQAIEDRHGLFHDEMMLPRPIGERRTTSGAPLRESGDTSSGGAVSALSWSDDSATPSAARSVGGAQRLLARPRLLDLLRAGSDRQLTFIHAPAGFGKSTLLTQWRTSLSEADGLVAELTLDYDDNRVVWFFSHLVEAIGRVRPDLGAGLVAELEERGGTGATFVLSRLVDEIHSVGITLVLLIDDWHKITNEETLNAMEYVLDRGCHHLRAVVASRSHSGVPFTKLALREELIEIDSDALQFELPEVRDFFREIHDVELAEADAAQLWEATNGWPAALQLVALSLGRRGETLGSATPRSTSRSAGRAAKAIGRMRGDHPAIAEYLGENVLHTLEPRMIELLTAASVAERICGGLAAAITLDDDAPMQLADAERRGLFLHSLVEDPNWFRFDPLFAEFLRGRLESSQPGRARLLHVRASKWFAEHGMVRESVDHALLAADPSAALDLVESRGMDLIDGARMATLLALVAKLPASQVASRSQLLLAIARANVSLHRPAVARPALDRVAVALANGDAGDRNAALQLLEADVLRGVDSAIADATEGLEELVAPVLARPEAVPAWAASCAANVSSFAAMSRFDFDEVRRLQKWASDFHDRSRDPLGRVYGNCYAGIAAREQLDIYSAAALFGRALEFAEGVNGRHSHAARIASAMLGQLYYDQGDLDVAEHLLGEAHEIGSDIGGVDFMIPIYATAARIMGLRGDRAGAARRLDEGAAAAAELSLPRLAAHINAERMRWSLGARLPILGMPKTSANVFEAAVADIEEAAAIRAALDGSGANLAHGYVVRARDLAARAGDRDCALSLIQMQLLLAGCLYAAGEVDEGKDIFVGATARCAELGLDRVVLDAGDQAAELISELREDQAHNRWRPNWPQIPEAFFSDMVR